MPEIKDIVALSEWLTFELNTEWFSPPVIKLRLSPILEDLPILEMAGKEEKDVTIGSIVGHKIYQAVQDWDFTDKGEKVPLTSANKEMILKPLLGLTVKGEKKILGIAIIEYARNKENFLKNLKPTSAITEKSGTASPGNTATR